MAGIDETITALEEKLKQAKAKKQKIEARKRAATSELKRKQTTRRKILVGAAILEKVARGEWPESRLLEMLDKTLIRPYDRALFGLAISDTEPTLTEPVLPDTGE